MVEAAGNGAEVAEPFDFGKIILLLYQGEGGNVSPYRKQLARLGLLDSDIPVEEVEIKGLSKRETEQRIADIEASIEQEFSRSGKGTFVHVYCTGRAALWQKEL